MPPLIENKLGTGRRIIPGQPFEIRSSNRLKHYALTGYDASTLMLAGLTHTVEGSTHPVLMRPLLVTDVSKLTAYNLVIPATHQIGEKVSGPEVLLRMVFNTVVEVCARGENERVPQALADYYYHAASFQTAYPGLFGYPPQLSFNP